VDDRSLRPGLTTVVFVDVEASTALLDRVGDDAGVASVRGQLDVVRERIRTYGGAEVKSLGDGLLLTFSSPRQAVAFALASQRALGESRPRVRVGINTGEVIGADVDPLGGAVNLASRITDRAVGGEVLVSDVVRQLVGTVPSIRFESRGRHRVKGFSERWHLWAAEDSAGERRLPATIGRVAELAIMSELLSSTAAGAGRTILVEGEAGIGKTHLVREVMARAHRSGIGVVDVTADEVVRRPGLIPYVLLAAARAGEPRRAHLDELLNAPLPARRSGGDLSYAIIEASVDLFEEMTRSRPVLLVAEDLQWADDLSIAALVAIVRRVPVSGFSVVGSLRPTPRPVALDRLIERAHGGLVTHLRLGALEEVDVHALASALTGAAPGQRLRERLRSTAGNPLFITELLRSLDDEGLLRIESGLAEVAGADLPANLNDTLVRRLSWLRPDTNELLRLASLLGRAFTLHDLAAITGRSVVDLASGLREASLAGLIVGDGDQLTFHHDLIRDAVYGHMLAAERRDLHRAAGQALAHAGAPTRQVAEQYARGASPGDLQAVVWLERAALETVYMSPAGAVTLLEDALALAPEGWPRRCDLQAQMIELLAMCGRYDDAEGLADQVLAASPSDDVRYVALRGMATVHAGRGQIPAEIATLHRAADALGAPPDDAKRRRCIAARLSIHTGAMNTDEARHVAGDILAQAIVEDDATTQCVAHQTLGVVASLSGHGIVGRHHLATALALFDSGRVKPAAYQMTEVFLVPCLIELDAINDARTIAVRACRRAERRGALALLPHTYRVAAAADICAGRWDDAIAALEAGQAIIDETGDRNSILYYDAAAATIAMHRGDWEHAEARLASGLRRNREQDAPFGVDLLYSAQAELLGARGELDAALILAETTWAQTAPIRYIYGYRRRGTFLVRLAVKLRRDELARSVTADLEEGARRTPARSAAAAALQCRGLLNGDPDVILEAAATYRETPLRPALAACCEDAADMLTATDRRDEAIAMLSEAAAIYGDLDAAGDTARVNATLRSLGGRRPQRQSRPSFGWEALTPTETNVSRLVAEGLTNPEIGARLYISRRTVETHLSHVFQKLGLTGRTQLVAELTRRTTVPSLGDGTTRPAT
jgi:class 3 adenylate cyclase/DNA-binding CsgD family transcriptional regulator